MVKKKTKYISHDYIYSAWHGGINQKKIKKMSLLEFELNTQIKF